MAEQQHRATADEWACVKEYKSEISFSCLLELRDRIKALEAATTEAKPNHPAKPDSSLVTRVAFAITGDSDGPINWKPEARAAILEVAAWLRENPDVYFAPALVFVLEKEAER